VRRLVIVLFVLAPLGLVAWSAVNTTAHRWSWRDADLDRNRLNLAISRGAESGEKLAGWIEHGEVLSASGFSERSGGDAVVVVRYERTETDWFGVATGEVEADCYRFTFADGYETAFRRVDCPS
jgi:hypothetical protein